MPQQLWKETFLNQNIFVIPEEIPNSEIEGFGEIDLLAGGPPLVGFSVAGYRNPKDQRNLYYREYLRFLEILKLIFFNGKCPRILTISNGQVKELMFKEFERLGYKTSVRIMEAAEFEVHNSDPEQYSLETG